MRLAWLALRGFRSYAEMEFLPDPEVNVLVGRNGAGKTNLLEAIAYLGWLRSFRHVGDDALVALGSSAAVVRGEVVHATGAHRIEVEVPAQGRRRVLVDGKRPRRHADVLARLRTVTFLPDDLELAKGPSSLRRRLLDDLAAQLWPGAGGEQAEFEKTLRQRNALLRSPGPPPSAAELDSWDGRLADAGTDVYLRRRAAADAVSAPLAEAYRAVAGGGPAAVWDYESRWAGHGQDRTDLAARLRAALAQSRQADLDRHVTTVGPHRDHPHLRLGERDARTHASQGEQRSLVLALRLAAYEVLASEGGEAPVLLLDDVFSELDDKRAAAVVERLPGAQVFITSARQEDVPVQGRRWDVEGGRVR